MTNASAHVFVDDLDALVLSDADDHHLRRALRIRPGATISVCDGAGGWREAVLTSSGLEPITEIAVETRPAPPIAIAFAPTKGDRPEWAVQKLTEVGVDRIIGLVCDRSVVRWDERRVETNRARWERIVVEAAMQSRRLFLPTVDVGVAPAKLISDEPVGSVARADMGGDAPSGDIQTILIGPEGGWSDGERGQIRDAVSLGPHILRAETASVVAGSLWVAIRSNLVLLRASQNL